MKRRVAFAAAVAGSCFLTACGPRVDVVARMASPDGQLDAVHAQPKTDATVGMVDWVYLVPHDAKLSGNPIFVADHVSPALAVDWSGPSLRIRAYAARVFTSAPEVRVAGRVTRVEVLISNPRH